MSSSLVGLILVSTAGLCFGLLGVFSRAMSEAGFTVPQMLSLRFGLGAVVLWALALLRRERLHLTRAQLMGYGALGLLYVAEAWLYFESTRRIPIGLTALLLYLYPALVGLVAHLVFKERLGRAGRVALLLATLGIFVTVGLPSGGALDTVGVLCGLGTAVVYCTYVLLSSRLKTSGLVGSALLMSVTSVVLLAFALTSQAPWGRLEEAWAAAAGLVIIGTVIPVPFVLLGVARIGASRASIASTIEPISAIAAGALFLGESLNAAQLAGAALVVVAVALLAATRADHS